MGKHMSLKRFLPSILVVATSILVLCVLSSASVFAATTGTQPTDIVVQTAPSTSLTQNVIDRTSSSWPWYLTRISGLVAAFLLVALMLSGIGMLTGYTYKFLEPITAWATHRAMGLAFGIAVLLHMFALLFDRFVVFNIPQLFFPFLSKYMQLTIAHHSFGSMYVALGILAFYGILAVIISSLIWIDKKPHTWKWLHILSYLVMIFVFIHALYLGTDLSHGIMRIIWIVVSIAVAISIIFRLRRARTI